MQLRPQGPPSPRLGADVAVAGRADGRQTTAVRKTVVIVEDNPDNALLLETILSPTYRTRAYSNGESALQSIAKLRPDLILLDISLPAMDGIEVLRRLRSDPETASIPAIAVTAYGNREVCLQNGFDDYIRKPLLDEAELLGAVARFLPR